MNYEGNGEVVFWMGGGGGGVGRYFTSVLNCKSREVFIKKGFSFWGYIILALEFDLYSSN